MIYVVMSDGRLVVPSTIDIEYYPHKRIEFTVDKETYMYRDCYEDSDYVAVHNNIPVHAPRTSFKVFKHGQWFYTDNVDCILITNPEEDEELNYFQSTDFNAGIIYGKMERAIAPLLKEKSSTSVMGDIELPIIQMLPCGKSCGSIEEEKTINATCKTVIEHFDAVYGKSFSLALYSAKREKQYMKISYCIQRKEQYKEMTVAEIEEALGYKIKIVKE